MVYCDYDSYQAPDSITLVGNQAGSYFIAPNIKATTAIRTPQIVFTGTNNVSNTVTGVYSLNAVSHLNWNKYQNCLVTNATLAYWNGRFNESQSNLSYCNRGAFGTIVTKNEGDYLKCIASVLIYAGKSYTGWRNVGYWAVNTNNQLGSFVALITYGRSYNSPSPDCCTLLLSIGWMTSGTFVKLGGANTNIVTQFRTALDSTNHRVYLQYYVVTSYTTYENQGTVNIFLLNTHNNYTFTALNGTASPTVTAWQTVTL